MQGESARRVYNARNIAIMGLLVAVTAVMAPFFNIYLNPETRLFSFTYLPGAVASVLFGPVAGLCVGFAGDFVGWVTTPGNGPYFPGFALSAMLQNLIYALLLYRSARNTERPAKLLLRILLAQMLVLVCINLGLNMLWLNIMYGTAAGDMYSFFRVGLKLAQFPVDIALLFLCTRLSLRYYGQEAPKNLK